MARPGSVGKMPGLILTVDPGGDTFPVVADPESCWGRRWGILSKMPVNIRMAMWRLTWGGRTGKLLSRYWIPESAFRRTRSARYSNLSDRARNSREYRGHGIGLNLSANILSSYGAAMEIVSEEGEYTRVRVRFVRE